MYGRTRATDITTCRRVHDVPFYGRTHLQVCLPSLPSQSLRPCTPIGIALASMPYTLARLPLLSDGVHRLGYLNVMWDCFYKTAFLQRHTSFVTAVRFPSVLPTPFPLLVCHPHFMDPPAPSRKGASRGVPLRPSRLRFRTCGLNISA